jgi:putative membrane protein
MEAEDATRRTRLASERTYLAWIRSGLTALAVALAAGRLVPELAGGAAWPYELLGVGYGVLGIAFVAYGVKRQVAVEAAIERGEWAPLDRYAALGFALGGVLLGLATIAVIVFAG